MDDPLATLLHLPDSADAAAVTAAMASALQPPEAEDEPPGWLRPDQVSSFRRALAAVRTYRGALLADPVGTGKTWVALAVARGLGGPPPAVLVPAVLAAQWRDAARRTGVAVEILSHEALSRGRVPETRSRFAIVDESHRLRNPGTRRYRTLARWLLGRSALLLSATPVANRLEDLSHQLTLSLPDDALAAAGVASLHAALRRGRIPAAIGRLVIRGADPPALPGAVHRREVTPLTAAGADLLRDLRQLKLSRDAGTRALLRITLLRALASSPAALAGLLRRYRRLLAHAEDAARGGGGEGTAPPCARCWVRTPTSCSGGNSWRRPASASS